MFVLTAIVSAICIFVAVGGHMISNTENQKPLRKSHSVFVDCCIGRQFLCKPLPWERNRTPRPRLLTTSQICDGIANCPFGDDEICTKCGEPPHVSSGFRTGSQAHFPVGATVEYECRPGFIFKDVKSVVCNGLGLWTKAPVCERQCGMIPSVVNGVVDTNNGPLKEGAVLTYTCNQGYAPKTNNVIRCDSSGAWLGTPECVKECGMIPSVVNGVVDTNNGPLKEGAVLTYTCNQGYAPKTNNVLRCGSSGAWLGTPECVKVCLASSLPTNDSPFVDDAEPAFPVVDDQLVGTVVNYVCTVNLEIPDVDSAMAFVCASTGSWIGMADFTVCSASSLPTDAGSLFVALAQQASPIVVGDQPVGKVVTYVCTSGVPDPDTPMSFVCTSTGSWVGSADCDN